ncbi:MAG: hypothetical protein GFH27_549285n356 [Chloroflexi bacterium AL-W]|nr:hypothetical protein [Chloroflexi bacterium AL-N1]NOK65867.1 hypothetical protein [Chloroflexi bacterium AL-N10]NOK74192.1 hypothetical protein [Chloroflexi bacterium AL-N5]NOK80900.1 hypothetical protein [Chloroflexi bacterium AL-W]NOK88450.1 hypothetical protein [Chloroflexi bacterium AL-N15]
MTRSQTIQHDLEEITPNRFLIHNSRIRGLLKGEGEFEGQIFVLTTWRRDGLIARLRMRKFGVYTLTDKIEQLPKLPKAPVIGEIGWRPFATAIERYSRFDLNTMSWQPLDAEDRDGTTGVSVRTGWVLRRRKGRGAASFHVAIAERNGVIGLRNLDETTAVLTGYAQASMRTKRRLTAKRVDEGYSLTRIELPQPYRALLDHIGTPHDDGWQLSELAWPLVQALFERLGVQLGKR